MSQKLDTKEMHITEHLSELRTRLIVTAFVFLIAFIVGFYYRKDIYSFFAKDIHIKLIL